MKKRTLSALMALALALALLPLSAMALDPSPETDQETLPILISETVVEPDAGLESIIPEFVPGVVPEEFELVYPSYDFPVAITDLGSSYDTRESYQTSVKNQGSNGLCWTFGAYAALEANARKNGLGTPKVCRQERLEAKKYPLFLAYVKTEKLSGNRFGLLTPAIINGIVNTWQKKIVKSNGMFKGLYISYSI